MIIEAVRNYVIFTFIEEITGERFVNSTDTGIITTSLSIDQTGHARWGRVTNIGPKVEGISIGDYILVEPGKWTAHFHVDGKRYWKTDDKQILLVSDTPGTTY